MAYDANVVMARGALKSLDTILLKAEGCPNSAAFLTARLIDDMKPLSFQVYYATLLAEMVAAQLSGRPFNEQEDDLNSYEKMHLRIKQAVDKLDSVDEAIANRIGDTVTKISIHGSEVEVKVKTVVSLKHMPNIYFHVSTAYAILRKEGVPLEKRDWSRGFFSHIHE